MSGPLPEPAWLKLHKDMQRTLSAFTRQPAWLIQQRELQRTLCALTREPVWVEQQKILRDSFAMIGTSALVKQQQELQRTLGAITREPVWVEQQKILRDSFATISTSALVKQQQELQRTLGAITRQPAWIEQQRELREAVAKVAAQPAWLHQKDQLRQALASVGALTRTTPIEWLDRVGSDEVAAGATDLIRSGGLTPSDAIDEGLLVQTDDFDESAALAALPFLYKSAPPALRRRLQIGVASLAVATAFYVVALAEHNRETAAGSTAAALLSLWSFYNAFLEAIEHLEDSAEIGCESRE